MELVGIAHERPSLGHHPVDREWIQPSQVANALHRQSEILQGLARSFGDEAVIRVFVGADYEDGRFDHEFAHIERLSTRSRAARKKILAYVSDIPPDERLPGRSFPALRL
ncbi:MAG: hypothetical protein HY303_19960, partial [Candidatus Wallbacteria bacterium]|nr:hypothetical protein [Candidatus Wallbacteria bacterium]